MNRDRGTSDYSGLALIGTAVTELVAPILIGVWVDNRFGWAPWGLVVGTTIGFVGGIGHLLVIAGRADKTNKTKSGESDGPSKPPT